MSVAEQQPAVNGGNNFGGGTGTATLGSVVTVGNTVVVIALIENTAGETLSNISSVTDDKSNTWTVSAASLAQNTTGLGGDVGITVQFAYLLNCPNTPKTATATYTHTSHAVLVIYELTPSFLDQVLATTGATSNPTTGNINAANGAFGIAAVIGDNGGVDNFTQGSGWTSDAHGGGGQVCYLTEYQSGLNGTVAGTFVQSAIPWAASIMTFKPILSINPGMISGPVWG